VSHSCNFHCYNCAHYSEHNHKGFVSLKELKEWSCLWHRKIEPEELNLLGGEPCLHKQLPEFLELSRELWPNAKLILVSNGMLLKNHPKLPSILEKTKTLLSISIHHNSKEFQEKISKIQELIANWKTSYNFNVDWRKSYVHWTKIYLGYCEDMKPYEDGNPHMSWINCQSKHSKQLYLGKIWKCPPIAYLHMQKEKYKIGPEWDKYLSYIPLDSSDSFRKIKEFMLLESECYCNMCPSNPEIINKPFPLLNLEEIKNIQKK